MPLRPFSLPQCLPGVCFVRLVNTTALVLLFAALVWAQSQNASISGQITDESGALVPNATVTMTSTERNNPMKVVSDSRGLYAFPNLPPGTYETSVTAPGFKTTAQTGITLVATQTVRVDLVLRIGDSVQRVEVDANASQLNFDNGVRQEGVSPGTILQLPLVVSGGIRDSSQFITFQPGVNTGTSQQGFNARINGGLKMGDEAVMDGVSMQEGTMAQSGTVAFADYRMTPDMVSEIRVLTSSYQPEYGTSTGGQIIATSKSGTDQFHGAAFEYLRNKSLNSLQFTNTRQPGDQRPKDNENQFGFNIGGPAKIPYLPFVYGNKHKTYFFADFEFFRIVGGASRPTYSIPSVKERAGDFSDWTDTSGRLIPIYDPATTSVAANGTVTRAPFANNAIPASRFSQQALLYLKFLPQPTNNGSVNNYLAPQPVPDSILAGADERLIRIDHNWGEKDHIFASIWRQTTPKNTFCGLPIQLCNGTLSDPQDSWVSRLNYDRNISPTILNHFAYGYLNRNEGYGSINADYVSSLPQIRGAFATNYPPQFGFDNGFAQFGSNSGLNAGNKTTRPSHITNDLVTMVRGAHTIKFGFEYRHLAQVFHSNTNSSGTFNFTAASTGLLGTLSGNPIASLLLGAVDNANVNTYNISKWGAQQTAIALHAGDTWKVTSKFTLDYGLRWDRFTPVRETSNNLAFFGFGPNPAAGNRPGSLQFASDSQPYPEEVWNKAFAPRIGIAYAVDSKTVVRAGYGIFFTQAFYPGWGGGMSLDGLNPNPSFSSTVSGLQPAFYLDNGFPAYSSAPNRTPGADNGLNPQYRPSDANHRSYSQQWNFTVERQLGNNSLVSAAYVASKGTRLPSQLNPINVLNPSLLSLGSRLRDSFGPNDTVVDGVPVPYAGWQAQLSGRCDATVAQALLPFPQYCNSLTGVNENLGFSTYHSLQLKIEKRLSQGIYLNANYTFSKLITSASSTTQATAQYGGIGPVISPFQMGRNKSLSTDDVPQNFAVLAVVDLPFGKGKRFLNDRGWLDRIVGGWTISTTMKFTSGTPFYFRNSGSTCNVPSQFRAACIPSVIPGQNPFAQSLSNYDPNKPMFNAAAFSNTFNYNFGVGERVTNYRGFGYKNVNLSLQKTIPVKERAHFILKADASNAFNNHYFVCDGSAFGDCNPFNNDLGNTNFGVWNNTVSSPRSIQVIGRLNSKALFIAGALAALSHAATPGGIAERVSQVLTDPQDKDLALRQLVAKDYASLQALLQSRGRATRGEMECLAGSLDFLAGKMNGSVEHFAKAAVTAPLDESDTFTWAMGYVKLGDGAHAGKLLSELAAKHPQRSLYPYWMGRLEYNLRRYTEAQKEFERAIAIDGKFVRAWNALGLAYDMDGQSEQAYRPLVTAAQLNRELPQPSPWPPNDLGNWYLRANRWNEAECSFTEALKYDSRLAQAHYHLARALEKQTKITEAIAEYKLAIDEDKTSVDACYSLSLLYRKLNREDEAAALLKEYRMRKNASH